jgi:hypothetical protein
MRDTRQPQQGINTIPKPNVPAATGVAIESLGSTHTDSLDSLLKKKFLPCWGEYTSSHTSKRLTGWSPDAVEGRGFFLANGEVAVEGICFFLAAR